MTLFLRFIPALLGLFLLFPDFAPAASAMPRLTKPPMGDRWFSISKEKEQTGFNHVEISEASGGYEIVVESGAKMTIFGFTRDAVSWERYMVNPDLSLKSFEVDEVVDGKPMTLKGDVTGDGVRVFVTTGDKTKEKFLKAKGPVLPPPVMNIYPLMQGGEAGKSFKVKMLDIEKVKVVAVKISVVGSETLAGKPVVHLQNDLYTFVDNDIWVDFSGNTVKESVRHGLIVTQAEDKETARKFLAAHPRLKRK